MNQINKEDMSKREASSCSEKQKKKLDKPSNGSSLPIDNNPNMNGRDGIKNKSNEEQALFKCDPQCKLKPEEIDHLFEILCTQEIEGYKMQIKKEALKLRESGLLGTKDNKKDKKKEVKKHQTKKCYDSQPSRSNAEDVQNFNHKKTDSKKDQKEAKKDQKKIKYNSLSQCCPDGGDVQSCSHENANIPSVPRIEQYEGKTTIKTIEKDMVTKNPCNRSQWLLKCFFNIAEPIPNAKKLNTDLQYWDNNLLSTENDNLVDQSIDAETAANTEMENIASIPIFCPISTCQKKIDVSKFLLHFLTDHKLPDAYVSIREVYAGRKMILNNVNVTEKFAYNETLCLCCTAYAGVDNRKISVCNQDLPLKMQHWKRYLPILVLMHKTSWSSIYGKHDKGINENAYNRDSHIYILWLVTAPTISPIFANVRIFEGHQTGAQSKRILCKDISDSQVPADFIRKDGNYLLVQQNELDLLENKMRIEITFDEHSN